MSNPKHGPWEQLTDSEREQVRHIFERAVEDAVLDVQHGLGLEAEHAETLFADWVAGR